MKINAAKDIVDILNLPIDLEEKLKKESIYKTVHYSTKIEGNAIELSQVNEIIENRIKSDTKDAQEIRNYYNALLFLDGEAKAHKSITEDFIKKLHGIIEIIKTGRRSEKSSFRDGQNVIKSSRGNSIVYLPPEAKDIGGLMKSLVEWIEKEENVEIPVPILAAIASYQFVTIHPFWDGNGRTARALATYILKRGGYDLKGFYSMEEFYDRDIKRYYDSLQMGLHHNYYYGRNDADLTLWITYFLEIMSDVFDKVGRKVSELFQNSRKTEKNDAANILDKRQRWVFNFIKKNGFVMIKNIVNHFNIDKKTASLWVKGWIEKEFLKIKDESRQRNVEYVLKIL